MGNRFVKETITKILIEEFKLLDERSISVDWNKIKFNEFGYSVSFEAHYDEQWHKESRLVYLSQVIFIQGFSS